MDYNNNESEGQNLQLTGEESSKSSSVLRQFALPKFDFDDNIHGHLRFDSLVESEAFLGIPSQEDNHWIEDFSRGSGGIVFGSSAAESCALPSHINVWSEATSTESVELLLKSCGQEEMVSGENKVEESCLDDKIGSSTIPMNSLEVDGNNKEVDNEPGSVPPDDVQGDFPTLDQNVGVKYDNTVCNSVLDKTSLFVQSADGKDSELAASGNLNVEINESHINHVETDDLANESLCNQVEENIPAPGTEVITTESYFQKLSASASEPANRDNFGETSLVSSNDVAVYIPDSVDEPEEGSKKNDENMTWISVDADNPGSHCSLEVPSLMDSSQEVHVVEMSLTNSEIGVGVATKEQPITDGRCNEVIMQDVEPAGGDEYGTSALSSETEKQLFLGCNLLDEKSSLPFEENKSNSGLGVDNTDVTLINNTGPNLVAGTQSLVQLSHDNNSPGTKSSVEDPPATFASSASLNLCNNPPSGDIDDGTKNGDTPGSLADTNVDGECLRKDVKDFAHSTRPEKENIEALVFAPPLLPDANMETQRQDYQLIEEDVRGMEQGDPSCEKEDGKSFHDKNEICASEEKEAGASITGNTSERNVERDFGSQPDVAVNTKDDSTKSVLLSLEVGESLHSSEFQHDASLFNTGHGDQRKETESESSKGQKILEESHGPNDIACAVGTEGIEPLGSAESGGLEKNDRSFSLVETTSIDLLDETCKELRKNMERTVSAQDGADVPSEKLIEEKPESSGTICATVAGCTDTVAQVSAPIACLGGAPSESLANMEEPLEKSIDKVGKVLTTPSAVATFCQAEESFTFDVRPLGGQSTEDTIKESLSLDAKGVISTSSNPQRDPKMVKEISIGNSSVPDGSERKARRGSSRSGKGSVKRGSQVKEMTPIKQNDRGAKSSISLSPFGAGQLMTFSSAVKPAGPIFIPSSNLPDLNPSAQSSTIFQQPFTALQQVQLRAQILVYGSIIQGVAPDEACMVSAFDGVRHIWEPVWHACVDRSHLQKSPGNNAETPVHLRSGAKGLEESNSQSEILSSGIGRLSNKSTSVVNPVLPLSSPFWSIATPSSEATSSNTKVRGTPFDHQAVAPLHPLQSPAIRNFTPHSTWPSQAPFPVPWFASSQSSPFGISTNYSSFPITEPVKLTPVKDSCLAISSGAKILQTTPALQTSGTAMFSVAPSLNSKKVKASSGQTSRDTKTTKRKKSSTNEGITPGYAPTSPIVSASVPVVANHPLDKSPVAADASQIPLITRSNVDTLSTPFINSHYSTSVAVVAPSTFVPSSTTNQLFSVGQPSVSRDLLNRGGQNMDRAASNADGFKKVEEANLQAQEAAAHASQAVNHCESVWKQLKHQMNSGFSIDVESKLASAAAAVAASACVAKAAAAAANVALSAAVQAKLMAEEAVTKSGTIHTVGQDSISGLVTNYGTPSAEISAAREAARRRIEAASAATRHAENLDAIVKAAELAAEAVSHTGKIVAMGDPFSMHELVEAGPDNYWKVLNTVEPRSKTDIYNSNTAEISGLGLNHEGPEKDKVADSSASLVPESNLESVINYNVPYTHQSATSIKEGSMVEVFKDLGDQKEGWFSASVVSLKDMEAFVCYTELKSNEGSNQLKEWVPLKSKDGEAPKIRIPHPMTSVQFDGTRKRRRAAVKSYTWSAGDKVDAWLEDCWREGVVVEKNVKDATSLGIRFSAQGETLFVKLWHLRPTLVWTSGQWIEWCGPQKDGISKGDTPMGKRSKLGSADLKGKGVLGGSTSFVETGRSEKGRLPLSADETVFSVGSTRDESKPAMVRTGRSVADKGGSGVVFGVPKPGKKRKFMEVSKHYVSDRSAKVNVPDDSVKLSKFLTRHGSGSRIGSISKVDKERQAAGSKAKVPKFGKPPSIPSRTLKQRDVSSSSQGNEQNNVSDNAVKGPISDNENESGNQTLAELGSSNIDEASEGPEVFSAQALEKEAHKKVLTKGSKSDQLNQGKLLPTSGKVVKNESSISSTSNVDEPRRSNRRIQPTSRLLEGLQSSLITSKMPSSSHDKSHRSQNKGGGPARGSK